jgi:hypothetical protein
MNEYLNDLGLDGRIILKQIFNKHEEMAWTGLNWFSIGANSGLF